MCIRDRFTDYENDDHFFGEWSREMRRILFWEGFDKKAAEKYGDNKVTYRPDDTTAVYTKGFPILELRNGKNGWYGDAINAHEFTGAPDDLIFELPPTFYDKGGKKRGGYVIFGKKPIEVPSSEIELALAKGFWDSSKSINELLVSSHPFAETLTLKGKEGIDNITFDIEYQFMVITRYVVEANNVLVNDSGLTYVKGLDSNHFITEDVEEYMQKQLNDYSEGVNVAGKIKETDNTKEKYEDGDLLGQRGWMEADKIDDYDFHFNFQTGTTPVKDSEENGYVVVKGVNPRNGQGKQDARLGGYAISSTGITAWGDQYADR